MLRRDFHKGDVDPMLLAFGLLEVFDAVNRLDRRDGGAGFHLIARELKGDIVILTLEPELSRGAEEQLDRLCSMVNAADGAILLPPGGHTVVRVASLSIAGGIAVAGDLRVVTGGVDGLLTVSGNAGLAGSLQLNVPRGIQRVEAHLTARNLKLAGPPILVVARGQLDADHPGVKAAGDFGERVPGVVGVHTGVAADALGVLGYQAEQRIVARNDVCG